MFTGLVEEIGTVISIIRSRESALLKIKADTVLNNTIIGDSIAVNGVCQTVTAIDRSSFSVDVLKESLSKTNLGYLSSHKMVNLERAMTLNKPLGGHIVQGHVQDVAKVTSIIKQSKNCFLSLRITNDLMIFMVEEGSVSVDGLSLTIAKIKNDEITINIIPHTLKNTTIESLKVGDIVNIEPDILIKATLKSSRNGLTKEKLLSWGY